MTHSLPPRTDFLKVLWAFQLKDKYISDKTIHDLAQVYHLSEVEIEGVVSFYHFFHRSYSGKHTIYLDNSIIAEMNGYQDIKQAFEEECGTTIGTVDRTTTFGLFNTPCIGLSDHAPAALIDFHPFTHLTPGKIKSIIAQLKEGKEAEEICDKVEDNINYAIIGDKTMFFTPFALGSAIDQLHSLKQDTILEMLESCNVRGRGGAFFPTWLKWKSCKNQTATTKYIVCNADEGEPGTFKDRVLINREAKSLIEGMVIAAYVVGANKGIIYLRGEYRWLKDGLEHEINEFRRHNYLGQNIKGISNFNFDVSVVMGAGSYVCGEETALLESLEGKRGEPRTKWYFPTEKGFMQMPTVVNNVETFCSVARLLQIGPERYKSLGIKNNFGTKLISISGDCDRPGIYEIEWGTTVRSLLNSCGAKDPFMVQLSGPSGHSISMEEADKTLCYYSDDPANTVNCGGSFMIFNHQRDLLQIMMNFSDFFKHESCGVCTPCRAGNFIIQRKLDQLQHGTGDMNDLEELKQWSIIMETTSRCGLGKSAGNTIIDLIQKFRPYFEERLPGINNKGMKLFDLEKAIGSYEKFKPLVQ